MKKFPYYSSGLKVSKKAFSKCGKARGAKLTVLCSNEYARKAVKKAFTKWGLSKKARYK